MNITSIMMIASLVEQTAVSASVMLRIAEQYKGEPLIDQAVAKLKAIAPATQEEMERQLALRFGEGNKDGRA